MEKIYRILKIINGNQNISYSALAKKSELSFIWAVKLSNQLSKKGLIKIKKLNPTSCQLSITPLGFEYITKLSAIQYLFED
jgi:predicted transcriptional regulator